MVLDKSNSILETSMIGKPVQWIYTPSKTGPDIITPAILRAVLVDGYLIDTEHQKNVKVRFRDVKVI